MVFELDIIGNEELEEVFLTREQHDKMGMTVYGKQDI